MLTGCRSTTAPSNHYQELRKSNPSLGKWVEMFSFSPPCFQFLWQHLLGDTGLNSGDTYPEPECWGRFWGHYTSPSTAENEPCDLYLKTDLWSHKHLQLLAIPSSKPGSQPPKIWDARISWAFLPLGLAIKTVSLGRKRPLSHSLPSPWGVWSLQKM